MLVFKQFFTFFKAQCSIDFSKFVLIQQYVDQMCLSQMTVGRMYDGQMCVSLMYEMTVAKCL
jgi:hypothetical protein